MPHPGVRYPIHFLGPTRRHWLRHITNNARLILSVIEAFQLIRRLRPSAILALAHSNAVPLFLAAKVWGIKCVFVESLTRVEDLSVTGRIIYHLRLAKRMYVQWPQLREKYAKCVYAGAVL